MGDAVEDAKPTSRVTLSTFTSPLAEWPVSHEGHLSHDTLRRRFPASSDRMTRIVRSTALALTLDALRHIKSLLGA